MADTHTTALDGPTGDGMADLRTLRELAEGGWRERLNPTTWWAHDDYPGWSAWRGVPGTGYYARRALSTPPQVVGPVTYLAELGALIEAKR
jgi:hypothetical protein